jgi:hypothetical protein
LNPNTRHKPPPAFVVELHAEPGIDGIRSLRALLKIASRRLGLRCVDVRELQPSKGEADAHAFVTPSDPDQQPKPQRNKTMSEFSERVRSQRKGFFKPADFENGREETHTVSYLDEQVEMFNKQIDVLNFKTTNRQLQLNMTTAEWLISNLGDDPQNWAGKEVVLYLGEYEFNNEKKHGVRLKLPGQPSATTNGPPSQPRALPPRKQDLDDEIPF